MHIRPAKSRGFLSIIFIAHAYASMSASATAALCSALAGLGFSSPALGAMYSLAEYNRYASCEAHKVSDLCHGGSRVREGSALPSPSAECIVYPRM
ncbi:uncharacterized protein C8Q71DRAFT_770376, partial [Rhodofomes roseus]